MTVDLTVPDSTEAEVVLPLHPDNRTDRVSGGTHSWTYPLPTDYGARPELTMDTPLRALTEDAAVWRAVTEVFAAHLPGVPIDGTAPEAAGVSLNTILTHIPGDSTALGRDLRAAISH